jgi:hypothetical protein
MSMMFSIFSCHIPKYWLHRKMYRLSDARSRRLLLREERTKANSSTPTTSATTPARVAHGCSWAVVSGRFIGTEVPGIVNPLAEVPLQKTGQNRRCRNRPCVACKHSRKPNGSATRAGCESERETCCRRSRHGDLNPAFRRAPLTPWRFKPRIQRRCGPLCGQPICACF